MNHKIETYNRLVKNKYQIYNSLFMSLPYEKMTNLGMLLPFLFQESKEGYELGKTPIEIMNHFFEKHTNITSEEERIDLLFRFIQYLERQVVLFDSIEEAAFTSLNSNADRGTIENLFNMAKQQNKVEEVKEKLNNYGVKVVFTAHPTQFYTNEVQRIIYDLHNAVKEDSISKIDMLLQQLGKTPFIKAEKPTPLNEANSIIYYLRYFYYDALGELYDQLSSTFYENEGEPNPKIVQLGFWPGGDRDGNPFVTAETTMQVANELRISILKSYYNHLKYLRRRLTFRGVSELIENFSERVYDNMFKQNCDLNSEDFVEFITKAKQIITEKHDGIFLKSLNIFHNRFKIFGLHFATLDIRQDSSAHKKVIRAIVKKVHKLDFDELNNQEKIEILTQENHNIESHDFKDDLVIDTIKNVKQLKTIQSLNGELGVHRYIISNSESIIDVLSVYALFKYCGYKKEEIRFDIVPLFETIQGLSNSKNVMEQLYNLDEYSNHLKRRKSKQYIMLGFSDGTKDGGYLKANWEIFKTKETLTNVSEDNNIKVVFFDGRGGPPARGGGKTHRFYAAQSSTIANNAIELTIQGQTITSLYGTKPHAKHNFEQLLTAGMFSELFKENKNLMSHNQKKLINELANLSYEKYKSLKEHKLFVPYLEKMSTLKYYGKTNIGSRPSKRGNNKGLQFRDLRAIPFVGSWSLLRQNVPGYFGVGTALKELENNGNFEKLKELFKQSEFFKALILNSMMSLQKTYFPLTQYMKENDEFKEFWEILHKEYLLSKEMTLKISEYKSLMQNELIDKESIKMRDKIVLPLLTIQQYALEKLQEGKEEDKQNYEKLVTRALFGNINASRNSA